MVDVIQYTPGRDMDYALLNWMERMINDQDIDKTLTSAQKTPSKFLEFFRVRPLFFQVDDLSNIKRACWFEPCMGSAFWGIWIHPGARTTEPKANIQFADFMINEAFKSGIPTLVGLIKDRPTIAETAKFIMLHSKAWGFSYQGKVPKFFEGRDCHIVALTAEDWQAWVEAKAARPSSQSRWKTLSAS